MVTGRPSKYKPEFCEALIKHMAGGSSFWSFAASVDVCMDTLSEWTKVHEEFSEAKKIGMAKLLKFDEDLAKAGTAGQLKRVARVEKIHNEDGTVKETVFHEAATFAQTFHIFTMKNRYPRLYRDKIEIDSGQAVDKANRTSEVLKEIMKDPALAEAAMIIAEKLSDE
jgi:hypothetical protein